MLLSNSAASYGQEQHNTQRAVSTAPTVHGGCITQPPQLELVGHNIVSFFFFFFAIVWLISFLL